MCKCEFSLEYLEVSRTVPGSRFLGSMAYAIIKTGGKQYRVSEGDILDVEKIDVEAGASTTFEDVLSFGEGDNLKLGTPLVSGAKVTAEVVDQRKGDKILAYKYRRRKGYQRTVGHRQKLTRVKITSITA